MKEINLPNNGFGIAIMLAIIILIAAVPFVLALWLVSMVAPLWVSVPIALVCSVVALLLTVKPRT